jgi:hypothetical protein
MCFNYLITQNYQNNHQFQFMTGPLLILTPVKIQQAAATPYQGSKHSSSL